MTLSDRQIGIQLDLSDGLSTNPANNTVGVDYVENGNIHIETTQNISGLFVEDLNGADGSGGGSTYDSWTTISGKGWDVTNNPRTTNNFLDIDRSTVSLIFSFGWLRPETRNQTSIIYNSTTVKDVVSICNEIDAPMYYYGQNQSAYQPRQGDLIQLVTNPIPWIVPYPTQTTSTIAVESLNRMNTDSDATCQEVKTMFVIKQIVYRSDTQQGGNEFWVDSLTLICIYSNIPNFIVGQEYTGTYDFTSQGRV